MVIYVSDDVYVIYYNNKLLGILSDSESFWYLYEWLCDSNGVCNIVTISKDMVDIPPTFSDFNKMVAEHGEVEISRSKMLIRLSYDDNLT
jgi:hypothetical protein